MAVAKSWAERIATGIEVDAAGCWLWQGALNVRSGYGILHVGSKVDGTDRNATAHQVAYQAFVGPVPEGLELDHLCRVRRCCNPDHLEPVTHAENMRRGVQANKTHCPHGHPYDEANTYVRPTGRRKCRACNTERERVARRRAA